MRVAVIGAGGVGGYFGAKLQLAGHDLQYVARGTHLRALRDTGLTLVTHGSRHSLPVEATDDITALARPDLALVTVKSWDTEAVAAQLASVLAPDTVVLSLQNGVLARRILSAHVPEAHLMGGAAYVSAFITEPGTITRYGPLQRIVFGEFDGTATERMRGIQAAFQSAGIDSATSDDISRVLWEKFTFLIGLSATTAITRSPIGVVRSHPESRALLLELMTETTVLGQWLGVDLATSLPGERLEFCDGLPSDMTSSMANDLANGRRMELDWLSGYVSTESRKLGLDAPANRVVAAALSPLADGRHSRTVRAT